MLNFMNCVVSLLTYLIEQHGQCCLLQRPVLVCPATIRGRCWWISHALCVSQQLTMMILSTSSVKCCRHTLFHPRYYITLIAAQFCER